MKKWFDDFFSTHGKDLIGAGSATREKAMSHYRFQHQAKMKEAVADSFPKLLSHLQDEWDVVWNNFWSDNKISPRNLDCFPEVFVNHFMKSSYPVWLKELARFEYRLDIHPWNHPALSLRSDLILSEEAKVILGKFELVNFLSPVSEIYDGESVAGEREEVVILWEKESGTHFRQMRDWEIEILMKLPEGVSGALEAAPDDPELVGEFFQWLGSSALIQNVKPD